MKAEKSSKSISRHPLIHFLAHSKGNPKRLILMEPLWGIPFNLIAPFATLYLYAQGITDVQIGTILSVSMAVQVFFSFLGGIITDKLGRKPTTMLGDFFGWSIACAIWAVSNNFWLFLAAALINSFEQINQTAWYCLLIEDAEQKDLLNIYTWVNIAGLIAVFFAPISGIFISQFTLVPVIRILYGIFSVTMTVKFVITFRYVKETRQGQVRKKETKNISEGRMILEYKNVIPKIFRNPMTLKVMIISILLQITNMTYNSFFSLYITTSLGVPDRYLAFFPILNATVMLLFMFGIQHKLEFVKFRIPMWSGLALFAVVHGFLVLMPPGRLLPVILCIFFSAVASALVMPRKDAMLAASIDPHERARITALIMTITIGFSSPFGYLAGFLSGIDRRLPFLMTFFLFVIAFIVVGTVRENETKVASSSHSKEI